MAEQELADEIAQLANLAIDAARSSGVELDYSVQSVEHVEALLDDLWRIGHPSIIRRLLGEKRRSEADTEYLASILGAYIGEVFRKELGGEWYLDTRFDPEGTAALRIRGLTIFPLSKAYKRLVDGPGDNVWFYYQVLAAQIRERGADD